MKKQRRARKTNKKLRSRISLQKIKKAMQRIMRRIMLKRNLCKN